MGGERIERAAAALYAAWQGGPSLALANDDVAPADMAEAILIQDALVAKLGHEVVGWKLGASSRAAMAAAGIEGPMSGRLFRHILYEDGARFPAKSFRAPILEAEFAFRMAADLAPRFAPYGEAEVLDAVGDMIMGVEIADHRWASGPPIPLPFLAADNAASGAYVTGGSVADWREIDSTTIEATLEVDGEVVGPSLSGEARCDPKWVLVWTANALSGRGLGLSAGDLVTTGTACQAVPGGANMEIVARFQGLGEVRLAIEG